MPTDRRSLFIIVNIACMPLFGSPTSQPVASSNVNWQVAEPLMPILCSMPVQITPLRAPSVPSAVRQELRHHEQADPSIPGGASGRRASTRWMMFSARSCSPALMKIFDPLMR